MRASSAGRVLILALMCLLATAGAQEAKKPAPLVWTLDLSKMKVPDAKVSARIKGVEFPFDEVSFNGVALILRREAGKTDWQASIFPMLKEGESIAGKSFRVHTNLRQGIPTVFLSWKPRGFPEPETEWNKEKYAMLLEFGKAKDGVIPGKIYACLPDKEKSVIAGTFTITETKR